MTRTMLLVKTKKTTNKWKKVGMLGKLNTTKWFLNYLNAIFNLKQNKDDI